LLRRISLDTRFRGYDGTQAGLSFSPQTGIFKGEHEEDEGRENRLETQWLCQSGSPFSVSFMIFVVSDGVQVMVQAVAIET
jgi:hypothetical protein